MRRGFTLIELLAVITILGILAFITTYAVINIIQDANKNTTKISINKYVSLINENILNAKARRKIIPSGTYQILSNGNLCIGLYSNNTCNGDILDLKIEQGYPTSGTVVISENMVISATNVNINGELVSYNVND